MQVTSSLTRVAILSDILLHSQR